MTPIIGSRVELQLLTTLRCNLKCTYCSLGVGSVVNSQHEIKYTLDELDRFIATHLDEKEVYVTFYGGEPTMNTQLIESVMKMYPHFRFQLQTNGTLLTRLPKWVLQNLSNILVSIDGGQLVTDGFRGDGIYQKVMENIATVRHDVGGSITARMTWSNPDTSFEEINDLVEHFDYLYFQFVAGEGSYDHVSMVKKRLVLIKLIDRFFTGEFYKVIPIMGILRNKLFPSRAKEHYAGQTQCRASTHLLNVMPDGQIFACPDMMYMPEMKTGSIQENWLHASPLQRRPEMPCEDCSAFSFCRGNCIKNLHRAYVENDLVYRTSVVEPICDLIRFIGIEIDRHSPKAWYSAQPIHVRNEILNCPIYEYTEVLP